MPQTDMTRGPIRPALLRYALPLMLGNLFQLTYHLVDAVIAGRFIGPEALAAEGIASPVMNLLILFISGLSLGAGVLMSELFGARETEKLHRALATVLLFGMGFALLLIAAGLLCMGWLLRTLRVPPELVPMTGSYLRIVFLGLPFTYFYNALSAALKSVGDTRTPLRFLIYSSLLNAGLDLLLIGGLGFGIRCSALTTVVAEAVSACLTWRHIRRRVPELTPGRGEWRIDRAMLGRSMRYGAVTALQQAVQPVGKLLIQGCVNDLGMSVIAAYNAVTRVDDFAYIPEQSIAQSITTFTAQNRGRADRDKHFDRCRMERGFRTGMLLEAGYWLALCAAVLWLRGPILSLFSADGDAAFLREGSNYLRLMAFLYLLPAMTNGVQGYFRGCGRMRVTLLATLTQTGLRVVFTFLLAPRLGIRGIAWACAVGWCAMLLWVVPLYLHSRKKKFMVQRTREG